MRQFAFKTDEESAEYCEAVIQEMVRLFDISEEEALGRMNRAWRGIEFVGDDDLIYHEDEEYWAKNIYYGKDSAWWMDPPDLQPLPYP